MTRHKQKNCSFGLKHAIISLACASIIAAGGIGMYQAHQARQVKKEKIELAKQKALADSIQSLVKHPVHDIVYHVDTLDTKSSALLYHCKGEITRNFVANQNMYRMQLSLFVHEKWHHHNYLLGYRTKYLFKPDEYYKLCLHDEITANIAALLTTRYQYMADTDKKAFINRYKKGIFGYYYNAIEKGEINPFDNSSQAREKEWKLIANGTRKMWMNRIYSHYKRVSYSMLLSYLSIRGVVQNSKKNYNFIRGKMYTIGGIDFWKYMDEDISADDSRVLLTEEISRVPSLQKGCRIVAENANDKIGLWENVGAEKTQEAFQHLLISSKLKYMLRQFSKEDIERNPQLISSYYHCLLSNVYHDKAFKNLVSKYGYFILNKTSDEDYQQTLKDLYTVQGIDLRDIIQDFNAEKVPVKNTLMCDFMVETRWLDQKIYGFYLETPSEAALGTVNNHKKDKSLNSSSKAVSAQNATKLRRKQSANMVIAAPNFWEPILLSNTPETLQQINKCIADFDAIPEVEKGCDLAAQQAYRLQQKQNSER